MYFLCSWLFNDTADGCIVTYSIVRHNLNIVLIFGWTGGDVLVYKNFISRLRAIIEIFYD